MHKCHMTLNESYTEMTHESKLIMCRNDTNLYKSCADVTRTVNLDESCAQMTHESEGIICETYA